MASNSETIYIKAGRNTEVKKPDITLGEVLEITCVNPSMEAKVRSLRLLKGINGRVTVSVLKVVSMIQEVYPNADVQSIGEPDFIVTYEEPGKASRFMQSIKVVFVSVLSFFGAAFSIMAFNNDVDAPKLFDQIYTQIMGNKPDGFTILELTYSLGLAVGILIFFNHFGKKKFTVDPTPMEVEMRLSENDIQTTLIETYSRKERELHVDQTDSSCSHRK